MKHRDRNKVSVVYLVTNQCNGKRYIGVTSGYLSVRKSKHFWCAERQNSQIYFHKAIRKYGREAFAFEVILTCKDYDEALRAEVRLIAEVKPEYNMTIGGDGARGFKMTPEQIERGVSKRRGRPGPWVGKELPESFRKGGQNWRISEAGKASWRECSRLGPRSLARPIVCLDDGKIYDHSRAAAEFYGINEGVVRSVCHRGRHKTAGGLVFRFVGDPLNETESPEEIRNLVLSNRQWTASIAREAKSMRVSP